MKQAAQEGERGDYMVEVTLGAVRFWPPERVVLSQEAAHQRVTLMEAGDITQLCPPGQKVAAFSGFFPGPGYPFGEGYDPAGAAAELKKMLEEGKPYPFSLTGTELPVQMEVTVEKLSLWQQAGEDGCIWYDLTVREYKSAEAAVSGAAGGSAGKRTEAPPEVKQYTVQEGDTLWGIAKSFLGDGGRYQEIASLSGVANPNLIYPGQVLTLPE